MTDRTYKLEFINRSPVLELSAPGPAGPAGLGIQVVDRLASTEDLPDVNSPELNPGDAYIINGELHVFTRARAFEVQNFVAGADGKDGEPGPAGQPGPAGPQGPKGDRGEPGLQGLQGPQGIPGPKGNTGDTGPQGPQGIQGLRGEAGPQGIQGPQGERGLKGDPGEAGPQGPAGPAGPAGPQGPKGDPGSGGSPFVPQIVVANGDLSRWAPLIDNSGGTSSVEVVPDPAEPIGEAFKLRNDVEFGHAWTYVDEPIFSEVVYLEAEFYWAGTGIGFELFVQDSDEMVNDNYRSGVAFIKSSLYAPSQIQIERAAIGDVIRYASVGDPTYYGMTKLGMLHWMSTGKTIAYFNGQHVPVSNIDNTALNHGAFTKARTPVEQRYVRAGVRVHTGYGFNDVIFRNFKLGGMEGGF